MYLGIIKNLKKSISRRYLILYLKKPIIKKVYLIVNIFKFQKKLQF